MFKMLTPVRSKSLVEEQFRMVETLSPVAADKVQCTHDGFGEAGMRERWTS
jgi:hypothetical protein